MDIPTSLLEQRIDRGAILHSTMFENIDHGKFFVIIGISPEFVAGFFFINSNINKYIESKPKQFAMQYPMRKADYGFLRYDSFLSATNIEKIPRARLADTIASGITTFVGTMKEQHIKELLEKARTSELFSKVQTREFLY